MSIKESALTAITAISNSDFVRAVTSAGASRRITVANLAKQIVEGYAGSSLAGATQSVKSAIDSLNSKTVTKTMPSTITDLNDITSQSVYSLGGSIPNNAPFASGTYGGVVVTLTTNSTLRFQIIFRGMTDVGTIFIRRYINGTWNSWFRIDGTIVA